MITQQITAMPINTYVTKKKSLVAAATTVVSPSLPLDIDNNQSIEWKTF